MADLLDLERRLQAAEARLAYFETLTKGYAWGTYTPTHTLGTNAAASTAYLCQYKRVGSTVSVWGTFALDPTAAGNTQLYLSLPIASNLASVLDLNGVGACIELFMVGAFEGDGGGDRAKFIVFPTDTANRVYHFSFGYQVI